MKKKSPIDLKRGLAQMLKGGVIMDVMNAEQAKIAEKAGAVAVMALERIPSQIRQEGGVARMSDPQMILDIKEAVSIPVMAKVRIGHFTEAQILEATDIDYIDESEVLSTADTQFHIKKSKFELPFVCGAKDLGEALRRIHEGAAMIRTKGEAGTGDVSEAVRHWRKIQQEIRFLNDHNIDRFAHDYRVPSDLVRNVFENQRLPVVSFVAGGIATPADAAMMMALGAEGVFVGSGIFESECPQKTAEAIVQATLHYDKPEPLCKISKGLGKAMQGEKIDEKTEKFAERNN